MYAQCVCGLPLQKDSNMLSTIHPIPVRPAEQVVVGEFPQLIRGILCSAPCSEPDVQDPRLPKPFAGTLEGLGVARLVSSTKLASSFLGRLHTWISVHSVLRASWL